MTESEYLKDRVDGQIKWYSSKSSSMKNKFFRCQTIEVIISSMISGFAQLTFNNNFMANIITFLGIILVILSSVRNLHKWHDTWIEYRSTAEMLKRERFLFVTRSSIYKNEKDAFNIFVERIEDILSNEKINWRDINSINSTNL